MHRIKITRENSGVSQRFLAGKAGLSYKLLQLLETGAHNPTVHTLQKLAEAMGLGGKAFGAYAQEYFGYPTDSVYIISRMIAVSGEASWKTWLFNFVDTFRRTRDPRLIVAPPADNVPTHIRALFASVVETLCDEAERGHPWWTGGISTLLQPWFVSGMESLKAMALVESPIHFRKRNIFVLASFLARV